MLNALAFSTLLSSQGADAHLQRTSIRLQGNYSTLPDELPVVNQVPMNFATQVGVPSTQQTLPDKLPCSCKARQFRIYWGFPPVRPALRRSVSGRARRTLEMDGAFVKSVGEVNAR